MTELGGNGTTGPQRIIGLAHTRQCSREEAKTCRQQSLDLQHCRSRARDARTLQPSLTDQTTIRTSPQTTTQTDDKPSLDAFRYGIARENAEPAGNHPDPNVAGKGCCRKINGACFEKDLANDSPRQALGFVLERPTKLQ